MRKSNLESVAKVKDPVVEEDALYDAVEFLQNSKKILSGKSGKGVLWQAVGRHRCRTLRQRRERP